MKHIGLFEGIGGFSLAGRWMGWETIAWCEWDEFGQKVLRHHFPKAEGFGDITKTDFTKYANTVDIVTGGFPCQPYSAAGKRLGKEDDRHLWPEMLRAIREIQPRWVVGENVFGLVNWSDGLVFHEVQADLEAEGYEVFPYVLPACAVNAPHRRDRVWFIAYSGSNGHRQNNEFRNAGFKERTGLSFKEQRERVWENIGEVEPTGVAPNSERIGQQGSGRAIKSLCTTQNGDWKASWSNPNGGWPTQSPVRGGNDGLSRELYEGCLTALGNAIVPQVALQIFKAIEQYENQTL